MHPLKSAPALNMQPLNAVICFLLASLLGCSNSSTFEPQPTGEAAGRDAWAAASGYGSGSFYPLNIGNIWDYQGGGTLRALSGDGGLPGDELTYAFTETRRLIGTTHHEGTPYIVEEQIHHEIPESPYGPFTSWFRLRQDPQGLFGLDTLLQDPPEMDGNRTVAAAARPFTRHTLGVDVASLRHGNTSTASIERFATRVEMFQDVARGLARRGDSPSPSGLELKILVYPLHPGLAWSTRPDFPWPFRVNRMDILDTPAGRISAFRIDVNPFGNLIQEGEWIRVWYSRSGFVGYSIHTFSEGTDEDGEPTGITFVADESMWLTSMHLER
jgi:hypothetical protein